jgi:phosphoglycerate dehydrogenase-like enzyme
LHTLIIPWAGLPGITRKLLIDFPEIRVHNIHHNALPTAEIAITLMLAAARKLIAIDRTFRDNDWRPMYDFDHGTIGVKPSHGPLLLSGKIALIFGYGAIGRQIARTCSAMGMTVNAIKRRSASKSSDTAKIYGSNDLHRLLPHTQVLFICLPLTPDTKSIIGKKELSLLPDEAIIINIARGPIIDEKALYNELLSGRIRAGLDVWYNYPREEKERTSTSPSQYPFHKLDNVVMTPHLGGHSDETENLRIKELADMLNRASQGEELPNKVDINRGY